MISACGATATPSAAPTTSTAVAPSDSGPVSAEELAHSVVRVELHLGGEYQTHGSGTVISDDGLILTNAHVAAATDVEFDELVVAVTERSDANPTPAYVAELVASDAKLDLAIIRIVSALDGSEYDGALEPVPVADSDEIEIGEELIILGYPAIGLDTITFTSGRVSGFTGDPTLGDRAWIKTDATISGGNSGGLAANSRGELVGVPTQAAAGELGEDDQFVDCRPVRDTNGNGGIDAGDDCVPIGGFLNGVRPVNLAGDMIAAVAAGETYEPIAEVPGAGGGPSAGDVNPIFGRPLFTEAQPTGAPSEDLIWFEGTSELCAWWEYSGMANGVTFDAIWAQDGEILSDVSYLGEVWTDDAAGETWVCFSGDENLADGLYDLTLNVEGEYVTGSFVGIGATMSPYDLTISNASADQSICYIEISPTVSGYWGPDWLGADEILEPGQEISFNLPPSSYDIRGRDCDGTPLFTDAMTVTGDTSLSFPTDTGESSGGLDLSATPVHGGTTLAAGFLPDPHQVAITAGGDVDASILGAPCRGFLTAAPSYSVTYTSGAFPTLRFYATADADLTLVVNDPSGAWHCGDDHAGTLHPLIDFDAPTSGRYDIWVGTYGGPATAQATLHVTETLSNEP